MLHLLTFYLLAFSLEVDSSKTIGHVKSLLNQHDSTIQLESAVLIYAGKTLDDSKTLSDYNIENESTLHYSSGNAKARAELSSTTLTSNTNTTSKSSSAINKITPNKKSKKRCSAKNCISAPLRYVGDCQFCNGHFCSKHRLLEQHNCVGLHNCKQQLHEYVFSFLFCLFVFFFLRFVCFA